MRSDRVWNLVVPVGIIVLALVCVILATRVKAEDAKPMPNITTEDADAFNKIIPKKPPADDGEGLNKIDTPKFVFGAGILVTVIAAVVKLASIVAMTVVVIVIVRLFMRNRLKTVASAFDNDSKDVVDHLIESFEALVARVRKEREKRIAEVDKLDASLGKLKKGVSNAVTKE